MLLFHSCILIVPDTGTRLQCSRFFLEKFLIPMGTRKRPDDKKVEKMKASTKIQGFKLVSGEKSRGLELKIQLYNRYVLCECYVDIKFTKYHNSLVCHYFRTCNFSYPHIITTAQTNSFPLLNFYHHKTPLIYLICVYMQIWNTIMMF